MAEQVQSIDFSSTRRRGSSAKILVLNVTGKSPTTQGHMQVSQQVRANCCTENKLSLIKNSMSRIQAQRDWKAIKEK